MITVELCHEPHQSDEEPSYSQEMFDGTLLEYVAQYFDCTPGEFERNWEYSIEDGELHVPSDDDFYFYEVD